MITRVWMAALMTVLVSAPAHSQAMESPHEPSAYGAEPDQRLLGDLAFRYRLEASELQELARRLELEAHVSARIKGADHRDTLQARDMAEAAWASARAADERASAYRRVLPHGRVF